MTLAERRILAFLIEQKEVNRAIKPGENHDLAKAIDVVHALRELLLANRRGCGIRAAMRNAATVLGTSK